MRPKLRKYILLALNACDGVPMPESALIGAVESLARPARPTAEDIFEALKDVEAGRLVAGLTDKITEDRVWSLTQSGILAARALR